MNEMDIPQQVQRAYDQIVLSYATQNHSQLPPENLLPFANKLIEQMGRDRRMLEIGCGTGRDMAWFESQQVQVVGLDLSAGMLNYAQSQVIGDLVMMDMQQIGFADDSFDGVWCCASMLHLPKSKVPETLTEIGRVLRTGSLFVLSIQEGDFEGWNEGYVKGVKRFFARYQQKEMAEILTKTGFVVRETGMAETGKRRWLTYLCQYTSKAE